ncbi:hypothetical protein BDR06DRAFT_1012881 [Suillus hirtellus]|nr:hypothetical protein BDR06DRAFT_1012881 [Suillus hirtellus]
MSYDTSPPPYQQYALTTPQAFRPGHSQSTAQGHTYNGHSQNYGCHGHYGDGYGHQPSIAVPTRPVSHIVIHSRYNESVYLLSRGRRRQSYGSGCCFFITIGAILILGVYYIVQLLSSTPIDEIAWTNLESHSCTSYATREYVAEINVSTWNRQWMKICMSTPVVVHGQPHLASKCESIGTVIGHFAIKYDEPDCVTYWSRFKNRGCTAKGSKKRRIEQHLMNVPAHADYKEFCATTPARFLDQEFSGADSCVKSIWGVYGQWFIDDPSC